MDFIVTPIVGTLWMLGEDTLDRYVSNPLARQHPHAFGIKSVRTSLNPAASLANILRGHFPWWRDYEHPTSSESLMVKQFERVLETEQKERGDLYLHYRSLSLGTNNGSFFYCRNARTGAGLELGVAVRRVLQATPESDLRQQNRTRIPARSGRSIFPPVRCFPGRSALRSIWGFE